MSDNSWTIRNVPASTRELLAEVKSMSDFTLGELLEMAVQDWYDRLPVSDEHHHGLALPED